MSKSLVELKKFIDEKRPTYYGILNLGELPNRKKKHMLIKLTLKSLDKNVAIGSGFLHPWLNRICKDSHPNSWAFDAILDNDTIYLDFTYDCYDEGTALLVKVSKDFKTLYSMDISTKKPDGVVLVLDDYETVEE